MTDGLIVALDVDTVDAALGIVDKLEGIVSFFKVGIELQLATGDPVRAILDRGKRVFLDLKYDDIPETVERAVRKAASLGVDFLTVHANHISVLQAAVRGRSGAILKLLAVTVLTSQNANEMTVLSRTGQAYDSGFDGVVCSGLETALIRGAFPELLIVTPGIRPTGFADLDQKRTCTPGEAIRAGADYLVVGRYITGDKEPRRAAERVLAEIQTHKDPRTGTQVPHEGQGVDDGSPPL